MEEMNNNNPHLQPPKGPLEGPVDGKTVEYREILIDLDCLLDTRIGLVATYSQPEALRCATNPEYYQRYQDTFLDQYLEGKSWREEWKNRTQHKLPDGFPSVIVASGETSFPSIIYEYIKLEINEAIERPGLLDEFKIAINVYPYVLPDNEIKALNDIAHAMFPHIKEVKVVSFDTKSLTPAKIRREYDSYWLYDLPNWLNTHVDEFKSMLHPNTKIFAPRLMYQDQYKFKIDQVVDKVLENKDNFFEELEAVTKLWFNLNFVAVPYYCLSVRKTKNEEDPSDDVSETEEKVENKTEVLEDEWDTD